MGDEEEGVTVPSRTLLLQVGKAMMIDESDQISSRKEPYNFSWEMILSTAQLMAKLPEATQASWAAITTGRLQV